MLLLRCGNGGVWCRQDQQQGGVTPWVLICFWDGALRPAASWKRSHALSPKPCGLPSRWGLKQVEDAGHDRMGKQKHVTYKWREAHLTASFHPPVCISTHR